MELEASTRSSGWTAIATSGSAAPRSWAKQQHRLSSGFDSFVSLDYDKSNSLEFPEMAMVSPQLLRVRHESDGRLSRQEFAAGGGTPQAVR